MADPRKPSGPIGSDDIEEWASAIDEWESNLPKAPELPVAAAPVPAPTPPRARTAPPSPGVDEPPPLEAPPAPPASGKGGGGRDPLMQLFDGEMDLPEEAGEALGGLLGNEHATPHPGPLPTAPRHDGGHEEPEDLQLDDFGVGLSESLEGTTPLPEPEPEIEEPAPPGPEISMDAELPDLDPPPVAAAAPVVAALVAPAPAASPPGPSLYDDDDDAEIEISSEAPVDVAPVAAAPPVDEEEFYDDIAIEREPSHKAPAPAAPPVAPEQPLWKESPLRARHLPSDPETDVVRASRDRSSDPDVTPLPVADGEAAASPPSPSSAPAVSDWPQQAGIEKPPVRPAPIPRAAVPARTGERAPSKTLTPRRLKATVRPLTLQVGAAAATADGTIVGAELGLVDTERLLSPAPERAARLAYLGGRLAERMADRPGALERYETALSLDPAAPSALRGLRALRLADGKLDEWMPLVERSIEHVANAELAGTWFLVAESAWALDDRDHASRAWHRLLEAAPADLGAALGLAESGTDRGPALARVHEFLNGSPDVAARVAVQTELGRLDENEGRLREAVQRYRDALQSATGRAGDGLGAAFGLLRVALRTPGAKDDLDAHQQLAERWTPGPVRAAWRRRLAQLRQMTADRAGAVKAHDDAAAALAGAPDQHLAAARIRLAGADATSEDWNALLAATTDPGQRLELLLALGRRAEQGSHWADALAHTVEALELAGDDPRPRWAKERLLERRQAAGGDDGHAAMQERFADASQATDAAAQLEAARLATTLGQLDEARRLTSALVAGGHGASGALELGVALALAGGDSAAAARLVAEHVEHAELDAVMQSAQRMRAARLAAKSDASSRDAEAVLRPLLSEPGEEAARWLALHLAERTPDSGGAKLLAVEAERTELIDRAWAAQLWLQHATIVAALPDGIDEVGESVRRALALDPTLAVAYVAGMTTLSPTEQEGILSARQAAWQSAGHPAAAAADGLRLGLAHESSGNVTAAVSVVRDLLPTLASSSAAPGVSRIAQAVVATLDRLADAAGDDALWIEAIDRELDELRRAARALPAPNEGAPPSHLDELLRRERIARLVLVGERLVGELAQPERAAERFRQALAEASKNVAVGYALDRAYEQAANFAALADRALSGLKDAHDVTSKVAAYERLAFVDGQLRGDQGSALLVYESILELVPAHAVALRVLERRALAEGRAAELVALYEQLALCASDPRFAALVHLDRARARRLLEGPDVSAEEIDAAIEGDYRQALAREPHLRPALQWALARARLVGEPLPQVSLYTRMAEVAAADVRSATVYRTRAGDALFALERFEEAQAEYVRALSLSPAHLPALLALSWVSLRRGDARQAMEVTATLAATLHDPAGRRAAYTVAGALAQDRLAEPRRAIELLEAVLLVEPRDGESFARLETAYRQLGDHQGLAALYRRRLLVETDGGRLIALHLLLARLAKGELGDRALAKSELRAVLAQDGSHAEALSLLAQLAYEDADWAEAADILARRARVETVPAQQMEIQRQLGTLYADHLPDAPKAIAAFSAVRAIDANDMPALERLSALYLKEWDWKGTLEVTQALVERDPAKGQQGQHLHRIPKVHEEGYRDARNALQSLREALSIDPLHLPAIGELSRFFDRQSDVQSMRVHLDRTITRFRNILDSQPESTVAWHALVKVFTWRRAPDRASLAAAVLDWLGQADADEKLLFARLSGRDPWPGTALADPAVDELLFDARIPAGFRHLFRLLDETLGKLYRGDIKRLGLSRGERLGKGHALRDLAQRMANDLGLGDFDLYISTAQPTIALVEPTEPVSIVIGAKLVDKVHVDEVRFLVGRLLKLVQTHMTLPLRLPSNDLAVLVAAVVRQFVPDFQPRGVDPAAINTEGARLARAIPKKLSGELLPFALECASDALDVTSLAQALSETADRAGLLAAGLPGPALSALRRVGDEARVKALLRFIASDDLAELRRQLAVSIG